MLAFDILLWAGRFPDKEYLGLNDRIPLRAPLNGDPACVLRNLIMTEPEGIPTGFQLPSGKALLTGFTAISDDELEEAKQRKVLRDRRSERQPSGWAFRSSALW